MTERQLPWICEKNPSFPEVNTAWSDPNGLLAAGGNLKPDTLIKAYPLGIFPWFNPGEPILWWSPDPRMVITPDQLHVSKSMRRQLRKHSFQVTFDRAFEQVIDACAMPRSCASGTWITNDMRAAYVELHSIEYAHSVEVWDKNKLVGGLYGVAIGQVFFGESMFSRVNNTSKIAMTALCEKLVQWQFKLIDCQVYSPHLETMGAKTLSRLGFVQKLSSYCQLSPYGANWNTEWQWTDQSQ